MPLSEAHQTLKAGYARISLLKQIYHLIIAMATYIQPSNVYGIRKY